ncbi:MAG: hypothetical protein NWE81_01185, partial [Candidatus Bathyarchaeota archaeon]|nr:hypothetical protein [Candidatus Bathyarchaeota archaeon]
IKEITMVKSKSLKALAIIFLVSGLYDAFGGLLYAFSVGTGRSIDNPPTHPFYAIFIASFLFCFAYLQLLSAFNIRRYLLIIGSVIIGRVFYAALLFAYTFFVEDFPSTFLLTGIIDLAWTTLYIALSLTSDQVRFRDLFLPYRGDS